MVEITKKIDLPEGTPDDVKEEVGNMLVNEILRFTALGKSPVEGERFAKLDKEYADKEHKGDRTPRLRLEGDMMEALGYRITPDGLTIGIMDDAEQDKADGHNNFSGKSKLPQRRFIPSQKQEFRKEIRNKINSLVDQGERATSGLEILGRGIAETAAIKTTDVLTASGIDAFLEDLF